MKSQPTAQAERVAVNTPNRQFLSGKLAAISPAPVCNRFHHRLACWFAFYVSDKKELVTISRCV